MLDFCTASGDELRDTSCAGDAEPLSDMTERNETFFESKPRDKASLQCAVALRYRLNCGVKGHGDRVQDVLC